MILHKINVLVLVLIEVEISDSVLWDQIRCSADTEQLVPEGTLSDIGRFPWLGVVQHSFYVGGATRFAITAGVLIHPGYAIAPAEDISKIDHQQLINNTKFVVWRSSSIKYALDVSDYILHPEYEEKNTLATLALLELDTSGETGVGENSAPVLPACLPISGGGTFTDLYAVKMTDANKELQKESFKMKYVEHKECEEFYHKNQLTYKKMTPISSKCAMMEHPAEPCLWDGGVALVSRQSWGHWKLLGFSVRGPGCGLPARFLSVAEYLPWINDVLSQLPPDQLADVHRLGVRRLSPIAIILYSANKLIPKEMGQCERKIRGGVLYKEAIEVTMNKNYALGFVNVVITDLAQFNCVVVNMEETTAKSNTAMWIEHYCHREIAGEARGQEKPRDYRRMECFLYFKSAAFVQFYFTFSFKALVEYTVYGRQDLPRKIPNPFFTAETTEPWWPTDKIIRWEHFVPYYLWWWWL